MSSTATRHAAPLTVNPTQNTAPVLDFRCLYTFDLRRKAKRWQDGLARFHTFNKRIMVYDEPRNFIGDTHWRKAEPIHDGDELQLDKGVLIQIGEAKGRTDQDISGLFEKRKAKEARSGGSSPVRAPIIQVPSGGTTGETPTMPSQLRPKTLNALLGTPKGRIGRATFPDKSPYEVRRVSRVENDVESRPAKRQRVMATYESASAGKPLPTLKPWGDPEPVGKTHTAPKPSRPTERQPPQSAEETGPSAMQEESLEDITILRKNKEKVKTRKPAAQPPCPRDSYPKVRESLLSNPNMSKARQKEFAGVVNVSSDNQRKAHDDLAPKGARLRIASSKPRKKLMYKELLPPAQLAMQDSIKIDIRPNTIQSRIPETRRSGRVSESQREPLSQFHEEQRNRLQQRLKKHGEKSSYPDSQVSRVAGAKAEPLFISDDELPVARLDPPETKTEQQKRSNSPEIIHALRPHTPPFQLLNNSPIYSPPPTCDAAIRLAEMDTLLFQRPEAPQQKTPSAKPSKPPPLPPQEKPPNPPPLVPAGPVAGSVAEEPPATPPTRAKAGYKPFQRSLSNVITPTTAITRKRPLRKTVSDTSTVGAAPRRDPNNQSACPRVEAAPDPWSREAWDLFGYGREAFA